MVKVALDEASIRILDALQEDAGLSNSELAERIGLSTSPCWRRVAELRQQGVLRSSVALVDAAKLGLMVNVFVHISLANQDKTSLEMFSREIRERPEIMECYFCLLYTSPSPRDQRGSRMPSSA